MVAIPNGILHNLLDRLSGPYPPRVEKRFNSPDVEKHVGKFLCDEAVSVIVADEDVHPISVLIVFQPLIASVTVSCHNV
jgi:hypothetical protein